MLRDLHKPSAPMKAALSSCRRHFVSSLIFSALMNVLYIGPVLYMLQVYDRVVAGQGRLTLLFLSIIIIFVIGTLALLEQVRSRLLVRASIRFDRHLSGLLLDTMVSGRGSTGEAMNKQALREFDTLRQALTGPTILSIFDFPWSPIYVIVCFLIHPAIAAMAIVGGGALLFVALCNERGTNTPLKQANEAANKAYVSQEQTLAGAEVIRALGMRHALVRRHLLERRAMLNLQANASFTGGHQQVHPSCAAIAGAGAGRVAGDQQPDFGGRDLRLLLPRRPGAGADRPTAGRMAQRRPCACELCDAQ